MLQSAFVTAYYNGDTKMYGSKISDDYLKWLKYRFLDDDGLTIDFSNDSDSLIAYPDNDTTLGTTYEDVIWIDSYGTLHTQRAAVVPLAAYVVCHMSQSI